MEQISVLINSSSRYKINLERTRQEIQKVVKTWGMRRPTEISLSFVGDRKMRQLNKYYRQIDQTTSILAFPIIKEGEIFFYPPDGKVYLGDLVISYPQLIQIATRENLLVEQALNYLLEHGVKNLLGIANEVNKE